MNEPEKISKAVQTSHPVTREDLRALDGVFSITINDILRLNETVELRIKEVASASRSPVPSHSTEFSPEEMKELNQLSEDISAVNVRIGERQAVTKQLKEDTRQILRELAEIVSEL